MLPPLLESRKTSKKHGDECVVVLDLCMLPGAVLLHSPPLCAVSALCCASVHARWSRCPTNMSDEITERVFRQVCMCWHMWNGARGLSTSRLHPCAVVVRLVARAGLRGCQSIANHNITTTIVARCEYMYLRGKLTRVYYIGRWLEGGRIARKPSLAASLTDGGLAEAPNHCFLSSRHGMHSGIHACTYYEYHTIYLQHGRLRCRPCLYNVGVMPRVPQRFPLLFGMLLQARPASGLHVCSQLS
jgi:hypothetical protein